MNQNFKKIMKVIVSMSLALVLSMNVCYGATSKKADEKVPTSLSISEAVEYALKHNGDILQVKFQQDQLGYTLSGIKDLRKYASAMIEVAEATGESAISAYAATGTSGFDGYLIRNKITEQRTERQKKLLEKMYEMRTELLKLSVENAYYNVLINKISLDDAQRNLDIVKQQTEVGEIKLKYGTISEMDYKSLQISQNAAELTLVQAEYAYKEAKMDFNDLLGIDYNTELTLTSPLEINKIDITVSEEKKNELRKNNITFMYAEEDYKTAVDNEKYAKAYYGSSDKSYKAMKSKLDTAEVTYSNAKNTLERSILSTYNNLDVLKKSVKIFEDKKNLMSLALGVQNIRLKYGTSTENEVITASINYNSAVNEYYQMLMNYNMLARLYEKNIIS